MANRIFDIVLIYMSRIPNFVLALDPPIEILV